MCIRDRNHIALVKGDIRPDDEVLVRVHSECLTGDVFGSLRCDCGEQLHHAMEIIDKEGKVKHIHFLSAFPDQAKAIADVLSQWRFRPYLRDGQPVEVETGILFGRAPRSTRLPPTDAVSE